MGVVVVVKEPLAGDQPPQAVVAHLRPGTHVPGDADAGVKLHNGARHNAVEGLDIGNLPEHPGVVQRFIEVGAAVFQAPGNVHVLPAVELVGNQVVVGVFTLGLAQGQDENGVKDAHPAQAHGDIPPEQLGPVAVEPEDYRQQPQAEQGNGHIGPEPAGVILQTEL